MSWAEARILRDSLRDNRRRVTCGLTLPALGGIVARVERRGPDVEKILAGGGVTSDATSRRWIAACVSESLIERKRFRWLAKNMLAKLGFPFMERKFSFISKSCFYEAYVKNT